MENDTIRAANAKIGSPFLTTGQAAFYLSLSSLTLEKMRRKNRGPHFRKHGRFIRYHIADLDEWSAAHRHNWTGEPDNQTPSVPPEGGNSDA